jgi:hypothetical protein
MYQMSLISSLDDIQMQHFPSHVGPFHHRMHVTHHSTASSPPNATLPVACPEMRYPAGTHHRILLIFEGLVCGVEVLAGLSVNTIGRHMFTWHNHDELR